MESIGIDVHKVNSQVCIMEENGEVIEERRIHTDRERAVHERAGNRDDGDSTRHGRLFDRRRAGEEGRWRRSASDPEEAGTESGEEDLELRAADEERRVEQPSRDVWIRDLSAGLVGGVLLPLKRPADRVRSR